jgi:hypothetical protein
LSDASIERKRATIKVAEIELELIEKQLKLQEAANKLLAARSIQKEFEKTDRQRCEEAKLVN